MDRSQGIPSVDLNQFINGSEKDRNVFVNALGEAFREVGFVAIKNHFLSEDLETKLYNVSKRFFELPDDIKLNYEIEGLNGQRGYVAKLKEHAKGHTAADLKEFFHVGQPEAKDFECPDNIEVKEVPEFLNYQLEAYKMLEKTGVYMLRAIALHLGLDENFFDDKVQGGNSILRSIHYFPIEDPSQVEAGSVRAAAHGDINFITLLMGATAKGLEIQKRDGSWVAVTALPGHLVVNVGDMLERYTNDVLKSTIHRVVNPEGEQLQTSRYSMPFFMHPKPQVDLSCLDVCISENNPPKYEPITAGDFLAQRLKEIGLKN